MYHSTAESESPADIARAPYIAHNACRNTGQGSDVVPKKQGVERRRQVSDEDGGGMERGGAVRYAAGFTNVVR